MKLVCYGVRDSEVSYFNKLNTYGYDLKLVHEGLNHENVKEALGAEAIMVRGGCKADRQNLTLLKENGLKYLLTRTVGVDHVDQEAAKELGLLAARVPGYSPNAISELAVTLTMMLLRHTTYATNRVQNQNFVVDPEMFSREIRNCRVGVIGAGRIGLTTVALFKGLQAEVVAYDPYPSDYAKEQVELVDLDELLATCDVISLHVPYIKGVNDHLVNAEFLSKMKDNSILINTARGEIQDVDAILDAIESGKLAGYGTDVLENEKAFFFKDLSNETIEDATMQRIQKLYPKVLLTPHIGSYTDEALTNMIAISYKNLDELSNGKECVNQIAK